MSEQNMQNCGPKRYMLVGTTKYEGGGMELAERLGGDWVKSEDYDRLVAALSLAEADARRYRWLRDMSQPNNPECTFYLSVGGAFKNVRFKPETVDAAIDAAIADMRRT